MDERSDQNNRGNDEQNLSVRDTHVIASIRQIKVSRIWHETE